MKIANIVYEKELINHTKVDFVNYINEPMKYGELDKSLPTLYVGWSFMKACNPDDEIIQNADILKKKIISNELYWEFSFDESKASHVKGVENFIYTVPQFYFSSKYQYINLDPVFFQLRDVDDLMDVMPKQIDILYNYKGEMIYTLSSQNKITGINLNMYNFFQFKVDEIIQRLSERTNTIHVDLSGEIYEHYYKILPNFTQLKRYLITILTK
jgi:hypothetical protein